MLARRKAERGLHVLWNRAEAAFIQGNGFKIPFDCQFREMELADEGWKNVARLQVEIVIRAIEIRGHDRDVLCPVLSVVRPAHLDTGDFGHCIGLICWLERPCHQELFSHRLRAVPGIDARASEEEQPIDTVEIALMDDV